MYEGPLGMFVIVPALSSAAISRREVRNTTFIGPFWGSSLGVSVSRLG